MRTFTSFDLSETKRGIGSPEVPAAAPTAHGKEVSKPKIEKMMKNRVNMRTSIASRLIFAIVELKHLPQRKDDIIHLA